MELKDVVISIKIPGTYETIEKFRSFCTERKVSQREVFTAMVKGIDKITVGEKEKRYRRTEKVDHYKTIMEAWKESPQRKMQDGRPFIFVDDVFNFFIKEGKSTGTARQYCIKKIPQNPIYSGLSDGWITKDGESYIITVTKVKTRKELIEIMSNTDFVNLSDSIKEKYGEEEHSKWTDDEKDAAYVKAYYEQ